MADGAGASASEILNAVGGAVADAVVAWNRGIAVASSWATSTAGTASSKNSRARGAASPEWGRSGANLADRTEVLSRGGDRLTGGAVVSSGARTSEVGVGGAFTVVTWSALDATSFGCQASASPIGTGGAAKRLVRSGGAVVALGADVATASIGRVGLVGASLAIVSGEASGVGGVASSTGAVPARDALAALALFGDSGAVVVGTFRARIFVGETGTSGAVVTFWADLWRGEVVGGTKILRIAEVACRARDAGRLALFWLVLTCGAADWSRAAFGTVVPDGANVVRGRSGELADGAIVTFAAAVSASVHRPIRAIEP